LEHVSSSSATTPLRSSPKGLFTRIKKINPLLAITVVLPTAIATLYFGLIASDIYVSESRFVVRSPQRLTQTSVVGALLQGSGLSSADANTYPVIDYIRSRDALQELNQGKYIEKAYGDRGDFVSRFHHSLDDSFESLWKYYGNHVVTVDFDSSASITTLKVRSFTSQDAQNINERLLQYSERLVNQINARAARDAIKFSQDQVNLAATKAKDAAAALAAYRNSKAVFDPDKQSALQLQQIASLQKDQFDAQNLLVQLQSAAPANPQVAPLKTRIATLQKQIEMMTGSVTGRSGSLSDKAASYVRLQLDAEFANKELASAMTSLENARAEAQRQQLYLERIVQPGKPDVAIEPKRLQSIAATFLMGIVAWGILTIFIAGVKEHKD
jgi:capsular polysaccharide transport system permease protein